MYGSLDISTSALVANRIRLDTIASNLAIAHVGGNPNGPIKPPSLREAIFSMGDPARGSERGIHVSEIHEMQAWTPRYEPKSPRADAQGYVWYPDINPVKEQGNMMLAARSYEANISAIEARKSMTAMVLEMLA